MYEPDSMRWAPKTDKTLFGAACAFEDGSFDAKSVDLDVSKRIALFREAGCGFICYPIGGLQRYLWKPASEATPPKPYLPDAQMRASLWKNSVCGLTSAWIDPDAEDDRLSRLSIECIENELNHANYLDVQFVAIELKRLESPRLATAINRWAQKNLPRFRFWIILPTSTSELRGPEPIGMPNELWPIWKDFQSRVASHVDDVFDVGFRLCADSDEEFLDDFLVSRWRGESFTSFWLDPSLFITNNSSSSDLTLTTFHEKLISKLADVTEFVVLTAEDESPETLKNISARVEVLDKFVNAHISKALFPEEAYDALQIPLQPLSDNLSSGVYQTFELDAVKYEQYKRAIYIALEDIISRKKEERTEDKPQNGRQIGNAVVITVFVLGAGRGPLVDALFENVNTLRGPEFCDWTVEVWAVEKNNSAIQALEFFNRTRWRGQIKILECDMRELGEKHEAGLFASADLIVSELLGSFGDNELSPECLDGVSQILTQDSISIPQSYISYLAPIQSCVLRRNLALLEREQMRADIVRIGRNQSVDRICSSAADRLYVVCMKRVCLLGEALPCFEFSHPRPEASASATNEMCKDLYFSRLRQNCTVTGFAGFFEAKLYKNVVLSTVPGRHTPGMASWAPAFLPLVKCVDVTTDNFIIKLTILRNVDAGGVWYSWALHYGNSLVDDETSKEDEKIQNQNGESQYMRL